MHNIPRSVSPWMSFPVPQFAPLEAGARVDVCVVGAGIAGMTTAYLCAKKGKRVMVLDAGAIGSGMTGRTTAHLMTEIDDRYCELERVHGEERARLAARSHAAAVEAIEAIVANEGIDCDFTRLDGYLFNPPGGDPDELLREYAAALRCEVDVQWAERAPIDALDTGRCLRFPRQGQFHPLKYLSGLARAIQRLGGLIHTDVHVVDVADGKPARVRTASGLTVECDAAVVCTNTPINDRVAIHTKQAPYMTYVIGARVPRGSVATALLWDTLDEYHYVRLDVPDGELLIVGGEDHKTGQADDGERRFDALERWTRERFPMAREIAYRWSGQVMETIDYLAYAGRNPGDDHVFVATGDSGMGMTHGTLSAILITDLVHGVAVPWAEVYDPARFRARAAGEYARENANVARQYADWVRPGEVETAAEIAPGHGAILRRGAHKLAAYRDPDGRLHERSARCTHMGCVVHWNSVDATWDCKCHGSRFDALGHVVSGPASQDLEAVESPSGVPVRNSRQAGERPPTPPL